MRACSCVCAHARPSDWHAQGGVDISNGLAWNKAGDTFYYIDTPTMQVSALATRRSLPLSTAETL